jgi:hypothetical protein
MPSKRFDENIQAKAVRRLREDAEDYDSGGPRWVPSGLGWG